MLVSGCGRDTDSIIVSVRNASEVAITDCAVLVGQRRITFAKVRGDHSVLVHDVYLEGQITFLWTDASGAAQQKVMSVPPVDHPFQGVVQVVVHETSVDVQVMSRTAIQ